MPNITTNKWRITDQSGTGNLNTIRDAINTKTRTFDFEVLLPVPEEIAWTVSPTDIVATQAESDESNREWAHQAKFIASLMTEGGGEEFTKTNIRAITRTEADRRMKTYGAINWYDWSKLHWGTKWIGSNLEVMRETYDEIVIEFDTAWCTPTGILTHITETLGLTVVGGAIHEDGDEFELVGQRKMFDQYFEVIKVRDREDPEFCCVDYDDCDNPDAHIQIHRHVKLKTANTETKNPIHANGHQDKELQNLYDSTESSEAITVGPDDMARAQHDYESSLCPEWKTVNISTMQLAPIEITQDPRMSFTALGILMHNLSEPTTYSYGLAQDHAGHTHEHPQEIVSAIQELRDLGYLKTEPGEDADGNPVTITEYSPVPIPEWIGHVAVTMSGQVEDEYDQEASDEAERH